MMEENGLQGKVIMEEMVNLGLYARELHEAAMALLVDRSNGI